MSLYDKKVIQAKKHRGEDPSARKAATVQTGREPDMRHPPADEDSASRRAEMATEQAEAIKETVEVHAAQTDAP